MKFSSKGLKSITMIVCIMLSLCLETVVNTIDLLDNYPNPFNAVTTIRYHIAYSQMVGMNTTGTQVFASLPYVTITIHDILGKHITTLVSKKQEPGYHTVKWDARSFASGIYCCRLTCGSKSRTITLHLIR